MKKPLYMQMSELFRNQILNNQYRYGDLFPTERELEKIYGIDRKTIRKALNILVEEGLLIRRQGKGTFVKNPEISFSMKDMSGMGKILKSQGIDSSVKVLSFTKEVAGYVLSKTMEINPSDCVWKLIRLRSANDKPFAYEICFVREDLFPEFGNLDFEEYSLYDMYSQKGHVPKQIDERIEAVIVTGVEAKCLHLQEGDAAFMVTDVTRDQYQNIIECSKIYTNSQRIKLTTQLS